MSKFFGQHLVTGVHVKHSFAPAPLATVSAALIVIVYLPAGKCEMVTVKFVPLTSSRNAAALSPAPSIATDGRSL